MQTKQKSFLGLMSVFLILGLMSPIEAFGSEDRFAQIATTKKISQKPLKITTTQTKFYFGYEVAIKTTGGSGVGKVSFKIVSGKCMYVRGILFTTSRVPTSCFLEATKAADKKYLATKSTLKKFYFDYLPGAVMFNKLSGYGLQSYTFDLNDLRVGNSPAYINSIVELSSYSSVRYRDYWGSLHSFWSKLETDLKSKKDMLVAQEATQIALGLSESAQATRDKLGWLQVTYDIAVEMKNLTWGNYLRDLDYFQ